MTGGADEVREAGVRLEAAREALGDRSLAATVDSLAGLLDRWRDPASPHRRRLEAELPQAAGFSAETVREGLARALDTWTGDALRALVDAEIGGDPAVRGFARTSVLLAGSIPMPTLLSLLLPLLVHSPVLAKTASRDPVSAHLFRDSLREIDPALGACLEVLSFSSADDERSQAFFDAPCVVATGSDETIREVRGRVHADTRLIAHGHRLSLTALGNDAIAGGGRDEVAGRVAVDVALWDQLGCLSPVAVFCEGSESDCDAFAQRLHEALSAAERRWPRGELSTAAVAAVRRERDEAEMRHAAGRDVAVRGDAMMRWSVVREDDAAWRPAPLHRFVRLHPVPDEGALLASVAPVAEHLAAVALEGFGEREHALRERLSALGASRICAPGALQSPPLDWHREGELLIRPLLR